MLSYDAAVLYAGEDKRIAGELVQRLKELGFSLWWDEDLAAHEQFSLEQMADVFTRSEQVIALWSENASQSDWVRRELELARELDKRTIPCLIGSTSAGIRSPGTNLPEFVRKFRLIDLRSNTEALDRAGIEELIEALAPDEASPDLRKSARIPRRMAALPWLESIFGWTVAFLIVYFVSHYVRKLPDLLTLPVGRISRMNIIYSGLILCAIGALMSGTRQILELVAAWRIMKKLRAPSQRERPTKPHPA